LLQIAIDGNRPEFAAALPCADKRCNGLRTKGLPAVERTRMRCLAALAASGARLSVIFDYKFASILTAQMKNARRNRVGHPLAREQTVFSAYLHIGEFSGDVGWDIRAADAHAWRQALFLFPPATALRMRQEPQVLSVRKNIHRYLPNLTARRKNPEQQLPNRLKKKL
jgi:hypothetical protein